MSNIHSIYKVIVSGVTFTLSDASLRTEGSDTLLVLSLLGEFKEGQDKILALGRNHITFSLIKDHLEGYTILPLDKTACSGMDEARVLRYLLDDADYYGLARLKSIIEGEM